MDTVYTALVFPLLLLIGQAIVALGQRKISQRMDEGQAKTDEKRKSEAEWRERIEQRLDGQDERIDAVLQGQVTQMRSDVTHKIHRYMDDLGCASTEEKNSLNEEYKLYCLLCEKYGIENDFVASMMEHVMALPSRKGLE